MELDIITQTPEEVEASQSTAMSSPMGGKHQRQLSLSAKWASSKALALEYLKRQRVSAMNELLLSLLCADALYIDCVV